MTGTLFPFLLAALSLAVALNQELLLAPALAGLYLYVVGLLGRSLASAWRQGARVALRHHRGVSQDQVLRLETLVRLYRWSQATFAAEARLLGRYSLLLDLSHALADVRGDFGLVAQKRFFHHFLASALVEQFLFVRNRFLALASQPLARSVHRLYVSRTDLLQSSLAQALSRRHASSLAAAAWWESNGASF